MTLDRDLDDILIRWHQWSRSYSPARGFASRSLVVGDFRTSRQYDDENGSLDHALDERTMRTVDFEISELPPDHRRAIAVHARALCHGAAFRPEPVLRARQAIAERLARVGVLAISNLTPIG